ncbi:DUF4905 domain-containing protein [Mucilaginibacter sp. HMF5004]|uniref:DUF4905 domain-containing protein n=1 Tax=Mucilaginibacter rivuli TaxID=2857527 RepID=UPI001C5E87D4|nr:DUF4905 domain-containing protein [Mucilaginibacter rivuli]MBW4888891.1 DUF4905 domain-containing protein [Mucilaginibacter rivuli]
MMLQAYINENFAGQIWKLVIDEAAGLVFAEIRDSENRQLSFAGLNLATGNTQFKDLVLAEKWLSGLAGSFNGTLFLHGYQSAQSPNQKGITAIDGSNGNELWVNYIDAIEHISINGPVTYNTQVQPPKLFLTDAATGKTVRQFDKSADIAQQQNILVPDILNHIPTGFEDSLTGEPAGNVHYMEHNSFRIVSLHLLNNGILKQILLISKDGVIVYNDLLNEFIQKLQPESFIVYLNKLIYIKNKTGLKVLNL